MNFDFNMGAYGIKQTDKVREDREGESEKERPEFFKYPSHFLPPYTISPE